MLYLEHHYTKSQQAKSTYLSVSKSATLIYEVVHVQSIGTRLAREGDTLHCCRALSASAAVMRTLSLVSY